MVPAEVTTREVKQAKFYKIQAAGVTIILVLTFLTSLTLALRILQSKSISLEKARVAQAEQQVSDLKGTQASLLLLKSRLGVIGQYLGVPSKQTSIYQLIERLIPAGSVVNTLAVDANGGMILTLQVPEAENLDNFVNNLTNQETNEGKITQVSIENLSRGRDNIFRVGLKIQQK